MQTLTIVTLEESKQVENRLRLAVNTQLPGGTEYICLFLSVARVSVGSHFNRRVISTELSGWDDWVEVHKWSYTDQGLCSVKNYKHQKPKDIQNVSARLQNETKFIFEHIWKRSKPASSSSCVALVGDGQRPGKSNAFVSQYIVYVDTATELMVLIIIYRIYFSHFDTISDVNDGTKAV